MRVFLRFFVNYLTIKWVFMVLMGMMGGEFMEIKNVILDEELKNVTLEKEGNLAIITINRPKALNALNSDTLKDLDLAITNIENDSNVYCVILTGSGEKSFVAGADIAEMKDLDSKAGEEFGLLGNRVFRRLENLDKPVIAAISGFALGGGCELAMACDIRIASEKAKFAQPEAGLGITPGFGGTQRLPRIVPGLRENVIILDSSKKMYDKNARELIEYLSDIILKN